MTWIWTALGLLVAIAGIRYRHRLNHAIRRPRNTLDDAAIDDIIEHGTLAVADEEQLDLDEAARAEEEFWDEYWDEPEEYGR